MSAMKKKPIDLAIDAAGGLTALAKRMEVDPQVLVNWRSRGIPAERVLQVEKATVDPGADVPKVTRHDLRPDLYPREVAA